MASAWYAHDTNILSDVRWQRDRRVDLSSSECDPVLHHVSAPGEWSDRPEIGALNHVTADRIAAVVVASGFATSSITTFAPAFASASTTALPTPLFPLTMAAVPWVLIIGPSVIWLYRLDEAGLLPGQGTEDEPAATAEHR